MQKLINRLEPIWSLDFQNHNLLIKQWALILEETYSVTLWYTSWREKNVSQTDQNTVWLDDLYVSPAVRKISKLEKNRLNVVSQQATLSPIASV